MNRFYLSPLLFVTMAFLAAPATPVAAQPSVNLSAGHETSLVTRPRRFEMAANGTHLLTSGYKGKITIWNLKEHKPMFTTESDTQGKVAWLCDEKRHSLAYLVENRDQKSLKLKVIDLKGQAKEKLIPLEIERYLDWHLQFNDDATLLSATIIKGRKEGLTKVFDLANGTVLYEGNPLGDGTRKACFIPKSDLLAVVATYAKTSLKLINYRTGEVLHSSSLVEGMGNVIASPDGKLLATSCSDRTCKVFRVGKGNLRLHASLNAPDETSEMVMLDGGQIGVWTRGMASIWDIDQQQLKLSLKMPGYFALTPDATQCVSYSERTGRLMLSSMAGYMRTKAAKALRWPDRKVLDRNARITQDSSSVSGYDYGKLRHLNLKTGTFRETESPNANEEIAPDGATLSHQRKDNTIFLQPLEKTRIGLIRFSGDEQVNNMQFSQDGKLVVIRTQDRTLIVQRDSKIVGELTNTGHRDHRLSSSGRWLASDGSLYDVQRKMKVRKFGGALGYSPDERYLVSAYGMLDLETLEELPSRIPFHQRYNDLSLSLETPHLVTLDNPHDSPPGPNKVRVWNYLTGNLLGTLEADSKERYLDHARVSPDGKQVVAFRPSARDTTIHHWDITDWIEQDIANAGASVAPVVQPRWPVGGRTITASNGVRITIEADDAKIPAVDKALREVLRDLDTN